MIFYLVISVIFVLTAVMFFDFEYSILRKSSQKTKGQLIFSLWFALVVTFLMLVPIISVYFHSKLNQAAVAFSLYVFFFTLSRYTYDLAMVAVHNFKYGDSPHKYRQLESADDAE